MSWGSPACVVDRLFQNLTELLPVDVGTEPDEGDACPVLICIIFLRRAEPALASLCCIHSAHTSHVGVMYTADCVVFVLLNSPVFWLTETVSQHINTSDVMSPRPNFTP